jgi:hypothetical protein
MSNSWRFFPLSASLFRPKAVRPPVLRPNPNPSMFREMLTDNRSSHHFAEAFHRSLRIASAMPVRERKFRPGRDFCNTASKLCQYD